MRRERQATTFLAHFWLKPRRDRNCSLRIQFDAELKLLDEEFFARRSRRTRTS